MEPASQHPDPEDSAQRRRDADRRASKAREPAAEGPEPTTAAPLPPVGTKYHSLKTVSWVTISILSTVFLSYWVLGVSQNFSAFNSASDFISNYSTNSDTAGSSLVNVMSVLHRRSVIALIVVILLIAAAISFSIWFHRAYQNLEHWGYQLRYSVSSSFWAWFVPVINFVRPKLIANDLWRAGWTRNGETPQSNTGWQKRKVPLLLTAWWGLFIISGLVLYYGSVLISQAHDKLSTTPLYHLQDLSSAVSQLKTGLIVQSLGIFGEMGAVVLVIWFILNVTKKQETIHEQGKLES